MFKTLVTLSRGSNSLISLTNHPRHIFNFFKKKDQSDTKTKSNELPKSEAELIWSNARSNELEGIKYKKTNSLNLTHSELKKIKKRQFMEVIDMYIRRYGGTRRGYNEFAQSAHKSMKFYDLQGDLDAYKAILKIYPKGPLRQTSFLMFQLSQFKRQQDTVLNLLVDMKNFNVMPDDAFGQEIVDIFGYRSLAMNYYRQTMYWLPKLYYQNPFPVTDRLPEDFDVNPISVALLAAQRICVDKMTEFHPINSKEPMEPRALVSAQSTQQKMLLSALVNQAKRQDEKLSLAYYVLWTETQKQRIEKQFKVVEEDDRLQEEIPADSYESILYGYDYAEETDSLPIDKNVYHYLNSQKLSSENNQLLISDKTNSLFPNLQKIRDDLLMSNKLKKQKVVGLVNPEPEFDDRWTALRKFHQPSSLPSSQLLEMHEQMEGTILALSVIAPIPSALTDQHTLEEYESTENRVQQSMRHSSNLTGLLDIKPSKIPQVPKIASKQLLRSWLNDLRVRNPALGDTTVIFRLGNRNLLTKDNLHYDMENENSHQEILHDERRHS